MSIGASARKTSHLAAAHALGRALTLVLWHGIRLLAAFVCLGPFFWMIVTSFAEPDYAFNLLTSLIPNRLSLDNYEQLFTSARMDHYRGTVHYA